MISDWTSLKGLVEGMLFALFKTYYHKYYKNLKKETT